MKKIVIAMILFSFALLSAQDIPPPVERPGAKIPRVKDIPEQKDEIPRTKTQKTNKPHVETQTVRPAEKRTETQRVTKTESAKTTVKPIRFIKSSGIRYVRLDDTAAYFNLVLKRTMNGGKLEAPNSAVTYQYNSRSGSINGIRVSFLYPVILKNGSEYISDADFRKVLFPVLVKKHGAPRHSIRTIMIDPGHGGSDPGAKGPLRHEKSINLEIANRLAAKLRALGFKVILTRASDSTTALQTRAERCEKFKPDLFISLHCNSSTARSVNGMEVFALTPGGAISTSGGKPGEFVAANAFDSNSYLLAYEIQRSLVSFVKFNDRGVKHSRFYVLRNASCPAVLIECGFLSNASEGRKLADPKTQERIAASIISGLARYAARIR